MFAVTGLFISHCPPFRLFLNPAQQKNIYVFANLQKNTEIQAINQLNIYVANALKQWYYKAVAKH